MSPSPAVKFNPSINYMRAGSGSGSGFADASGVVQDEASIVSSITPEDIMATRRQNAIK